MGTLERWMPFKFRRKKAEEKAKEVKAETPKRSMMMPFEGMPLSQWMQHAFDTPFFRDPFARLEEMDRWFGDFSPSRFDAAVDVVDDEGSLRVAAELPGMTKEDVQLSIDNDVLTIRGEKKNDEETRENGAFRTERYYGFVQRSIPLPSNLDYDHAEAKFDKGVLTVRLPKTKGKKESGTNISIK